MSGAGDPGLRAYREMLAATFTLVQGDRPVAPETPDWFPWGAFAALEDGRVMVAGPFVFFDDAVASVVEALDHAAAAVDRTAAPGER